MKAEGDIQATRRRNTVNVCPRAVCTVWNVYYLRAINLCQVIKLN